MFNFKNNHLQSSDTPPQYPLPKPDWQPWRVLTTGFLILLLGTIVFNLIQIGLMPLFGLNVATVTEKMGAGGIIENVPYLRLILFINQILMFGIPAIATLYLAYSKRWIWAIGFEQTPKLSWFLLTIVWWAVSMPLIQFIYWVNLKLPLSQWIKNTDNQQNELIELILHYQNGAELTLVVVLLAILPAICEEFFFRGFLQRQLKRLFNNEVSAVFAAAFIFSAIHFQFQGFLPRMALGIILGFSLMWTKSIWIPIVLHATHNLFSLLGFLFFGQKITNQEEELDKINENFFIYLAAAAVSWTLVYFLGKYIHQITTKNKSSYNS